MSSVFMTNEMIKLTRSLFDEVKQKPINPMKILKEQCYCRFALKVESIFIGQLAISIQLKLIEVVFRKKNTASLTSLLCPNVCLFDKEEDSSPLVISTCHPSIFFNSFRVNRPS